MGASGLFAAKGKRPRPVAGAGGRYSLGSEHGRKERLAVTNYALMLAYANRIVKRNFKNFPGSGIRTEKGRFIHKDAVN